MHFCVNNWQLISTHTLEVYIFDCNKYNSMFTYCTYSFLFINIPIWWQCYIIAPNYTRNICKEWKSKWNNNIVRTHLYIVYKALNVTFMNYSSNRIKIILKNMIWSWGGGGGGAGEAPSHSHTHTPEPRACAKGRRGPGRWRTQRALRAGGRRGRGVEGRGGSCGRVNPPPRAAQVGRACGARGGAWLPTAL